MKNRIDLNERVLDFVHARQAMWYKQCRQGRLGTRNQNKQAHHQSEPDSPSAACRVTTKPLNGRRAGTNILEFRA
jgi:hypothetical protein